MKTNIFRILVSYLSILLFVLIGCEQSDPPDFGRDGDIITFSGRTWKIKHSESQMGPGPNWFSDYVNDVYVDNSGRLHMKIAEHDGKWYATEVVSEDNLGYGTYIFTVIGDLINIPENIVLGLFTWDDSTFYEQANSEIDIEFAQWGNAENFNTLHYSAQPVNFGPYYPERTHNADTDSLNLIGVSTHGFTWTDTLVTWKSYTGYTYGEGEPIAEWSFDNTNLARVKNEGGNSSLPVVIPEPGANTNARINFWILPHIDTKPTDGLEHEVIIDSFEYIPL